MKTSYILLLSTVNLSTKYHSYPTKGFWKLKKHIR